MRGRTRLMVVVRHSNMTWMDVPTPTNEQSWLKMVEFVESMPDPDWKEWKAELAPLLRQGITCGLHHYFLAGQSMQHILFSLINQYGLQDEPRVTIAFEKGKKLFVALSTSNIWFNEPSERSSLVCPDAFNVFKVFLAKLWLACKPREPLPAELRIA
jgi:hypothetical protein